MIFLVIAVISAFLAFKSPYILDSSAHIVADLLLALEEYSWSKDVETLRKTLKINDEVMQKLRDVNIQ